MEEMVTNLLMSEFLSHQEGPGVYWSQISQEAQYTRGLEATGGQRSGGRHCWGCNRRARGRQQCRS